MEKATQTMLEYEYCLWKVYVQIDAENLRACLILPTLI
jgi:hypothetical protein